MNNYQEVPPGHDTWPWAESESGGTLALEAPRTRALRQRKETSACVGPEENLVNMDFVDRFTSGSAAQRFSPDTLFKFTDL